MLLGNGIRICYNGMMGRKWKRQILTQDPFLTATQYKCHVVSNLLLGILRTDDGWMLSVEEEIPVLGGWLS